MRAALLMLLAAGLCTLAHAQPRPQLSAAEAARHTQADYLGDWQPAPLGDPARWTPDFIVAADGSGSHRTVQAALDALPAKGSSGARRHYILIRPGTYREPLCARDKVPFTLYGLGEPAEVLLVEGRYNALPKAPDSPAHSCLPELGASSHGTAGSTSVALFSDEVQLLRLSVANDAMERVRQGQGYPAGVGESGGAQAVALMTRGDRIQLEQVRLLGHQDTFYAERPAPQASARVLVRDSEIAGDVDFIFGGATLVIDRSLILSRAGRRVPGHGGHVLAPSTPPGQPHGFLVQRSRLLAEPGVAPGLISLGRAWDHGVAKGEWQAGVSPNGQALIRDSLLGPHLGPWSASTSRRPFAAQGLQANRMAEFANHSLPQAAYEGLPAGQGWAAMEGGTQGGAQARPQQVLAVRNRAELDAALALGSQPKIIALLARIDLSADTQGRRLGLEDYRDPEFDPAAFERAYDPATWGRQPPSGALEEARRRSAKRQAAQVVLRLPSHTTLIGLAPDAGFEGGMLLLEKVEQVILRHLRFADAYDYFPAWDPNDNGHGEWNSEYDTVSLRQARHVWVDHCSFDDGGRPDQQERVALGQRMQRHDGLLDITRQSDMVTVSWNVFRRHDKTMLIGGGDGQSQDAGRLRVTLHHNLWEEVKERTPRVRYGQVHVLNNLFISRSEAAYAYGYSLGVGLQSALLSEANVWEASPDIGPERLVRLLKGQRFEDRGSWLNGQPVDLLAALRAGSPQARIEGQSGWTPPYALQAEPPAGLATRIRAQAGAGRLW
jgi:pectin methylesterase-like acyl-CoA thioesterase/pectate lyase